MATALNNIWYLALYQEEQFDAYRCPAPFGLQPPLGNVNVERIW